MGLSRAGQWRVKQRPDGPTEPEALASLSGGPATASQLVSLLLSSPSSPFTTQWPEDSEKHTRVMALPASDPLSTSSPPPLTWTTEAHAFWLLPSPFMSWAPALNKGPVFRSQICGVSSGFSTSTQKTPMAHTLTLHLGQPALRSEQSVSPKGSLPEHPLPAPT